MQTIVDGRQPAVRIRDLQSLRQVAHRLRRQVVTMAARKGQGYVQQGLGAADIFAALYFAEMRLDPGDPDWPDRDRFLLSTAHNTALFYATLAARGFLDEAELPSYVEDGSALEINASERVGTMVEATCGSLGQGLSVAVGMALGARLNRSDARVYVVIGDGEMQEGQLWEAAMSAASLKLGNLCAILDLNRMQAGGDIDKVVAMEPIADKWRSFGFAVDEIDGNDMAALLASLDHARTVADRPSMIVARTLVGKGAPSLEGRLGHYFDLPEPLARRVLEELGEEPA